MALCCASGAWALLALGLLLTVRLHVAEAASSPWLYPSDQPLLDLTPDSFEAELIKPAPFLVVYSGPRCARTLPSRCSDPRDVCGSEAFGVLRRSERCKLFAKEWCAASPGGLLSESQSCCGPPLAISSHADCYSRACWRSLCTLRCRLRVAEALNASGVVTGAVNAEEHKALGGAQRALLCSSAHLKSLRTCVVAQPKVAALGLRRLERRRARAGRRPRREAVPARRGRPGDRRELPRRSQGQGRGGLGAGPGQTRSTGPPGCHDGRCAGRSSGCHSPGSECCVAWGYVEYANRQGLHAADSCQPCRACYRLWCLSSEASAGGMRVCSHVKTDARVAPALVPVWQ